MDQKSQSSLTPSTPNGSEQTPGDWQPNQNTGFRKHLNVMSLLVLLAPIYAVITNTIYLIDPRWLYAWFHVCTPLVDLAAKGPPIIDNYTFQLLEHGYNLKAIYVRHVLGMTFLISSVLGLLCVWRSFTGYGWGVCGCAPMPSMLEGAPLKGLYRGLGIVVLVCLLGAWPILWGIDIKYHDPSRYSVKLHLSNFDLIIFSGGFALIWTFFAGVVKSLRLIFDRYREG